MKKKKRFDQLFIFTQLFIFGLVLGVPFVINGKAYLEFMQTQPIINIMAIIIATFLVGLFVEGYVKKRLKF